MGVQRDIVTTNNSESMHALYKRCENWKEVHVDRLVFEMFRLQLGYGLKINKSLGGFKPYVLVDKHLPVDMLMLPLNFEYDEFINWLPEIGDNTESIPEVITVTVHFSFC
jgi:hypothetical protein